MTDAIDPPFPARAGREAGPWRASPATLAGVGEGGGPEYRAVFDGTNTDLWPITLRNAILNLLTLFFYRFWGRTRVRRYLWARTSFLGSRFAYTGTGRELFIGFLIVFFLVLLPLLGISVYVAYHWGTDVIARTAYAYGIGILSYFLFHIASYRALRYRLSRTNWRGIRGTQTGSALLYGLKALGWLLLVPFSMGLLYPVQRVSLTGTKLNNAWFGDRRFTFDSQGKSGQLYRPFMRAWLGFIFKPLGYMILLILLLSLIGGLSQATGRNIDVNSILAIQLLVWALIGIGVLRTYARYRAREVAIMAPWVGFGNLRFAFAAEHERMFQLMFGNILITLFTLGLGKPFAQKRTLAFVTEHLRVIGETDDLHVLRQSKDKGPGTGEGLADAFDAGSI